MSAPARTLWDIEGDLTALEHLLLASGGEITEEEAEAEVDRWLGALAETKAELSEKIDAFCGLIRELRTRAELRKREATQLSTHAHELLDAAISDLGIDKIRAEAVRIDDLSMRDDLTASSLESRLLAFFQTHGHKTLETLRFRITAALVGGKRALVLDEQNVPAEYQKTVMVPDKDKIRAHLEAGGQLGFARLEDRGMRLSIK